VTCVGIQVHDEDELVAGPESSSGGYHAVAAVDVRFCMPVGGKFASATCVALACRTAARHGSRQEPAKHPGASLLAPCAARSLLLYVVVDRDPGRLAIMPQTGCLAEHTRGGPPTIQGWHPVLQIVIGGAQSTPYLKVVHLPFSGGAGRRQLFHQPVSCGVVQERFGSQSRTTCDSEWMPSQPRNAALIALLFDTVSSLPPR